MKKVLAFVLALAMMLTMAVTVASAEDVTLTMWIWDDAQAPAMQAMIDGFTAQNPGIKVELTSVAGVTDYNTKMQAVFGSADAPSVFWMNFNLSKEYVPMGFVQDLTEAVTTYGIDMSKLNAGITDAYTVDGKLYAIPKDTDSYAVYYNKALFDAAGVAYPNDDWTIDDFVETAKALTTDKTVGWSNTTSDRVYYNFMVSNGGKIYSDDGTEALVNSPECVEVVQKLMDLFNGGYAYNGSQLAEVDASAAFTSGLAAMDIDGSWMISQFADALGDNLGICQLPSGPAGKGSAGHGIGYATTTSNPHMEETLKFLAYLATDEAQEMQANVVIPAANAAAAKWEEVYPNVNVNAFVQALGYSFPVPLAATNATVTRSTFQEYLGNMLQGQYATAQEALDAAKEAMDFAIEE